MKVGVVTVPYISNEILYNYAVQTIDSLISEKHELIKIAIINYCETAFIQLFDKLDHFELNDRNLLARAWNKGIKIATEEYNCDYVLVPNLDVVLHPKAIDELVALAEKTKDTNTVLWSASVVWHLSDLRFDYNIEQLGESADFACFMVNANTIKKIGMFDERYEPAYFEDNDYHRRIILSGHKALITSKAKFYHYGSSTIKTDNKLRSQNSRTFAENKQKYIKQWGGEPGKEMLTVPTEAPIVYP